jgi:hypothetical protein
MENTKIKSCTCTDQHQDTIYGKFKRLMNIFGKPFKGYKCTVCGKQHLESHNSKSKK